MVKLELQIFAYKCDKTRRFLENETACMSQNHERSLDVQFIHKMFLLCYCYNM